MARKVGIVHGIEGWLGYQRVAGRLGLSLDMRSHIQQIYRKRQVNTKSPVIAKAWQ